MILINKLSLMQKKFYFKLKENQNEIIKRVNTKKNNKNLV